MCNELGDLRCGLVLVEGAGCDRAEENEMKSQLLSIIHSFNHICKRRHDDGDATSRVDFLARFRDLFRSLFLSLNYSNLV